MIGPAPASIRPTRRRIKRAHDALAEIGFGDQQGAQPLRRNGDGFDVGQRRLVDEIRPAGQLRELAHEIAALVRDDVRRARRCSGWVTSTWPDRISISPRPTSPTRASDVARLVTARLTEPARAAQFPHR